LLVSQDFPRLIDRFKALGGLGVGIHVGMVLASEFFVGFFDGFGVCVFGYAEDMVGILHDNFL